MVTTQYDYITCKHKHRINNRTGCNHIFLRHLSNTPVSTTTGLLVSCFWRNSWVSIIDNQTAGNSLIKLMIDLGIALNMMAAHHMKETRVVNTIKQLWLSHTLFAIFAGFLCLPCYHGCWLSMILNICVFHHVVYMDNIYIFKTVLHNTVC